MKFICLQAGHQGRTSGSTGAPGEIDVNIRIRDRLAQLLIENGFVVQLVNADPTTEEINKDFDLFLALHCDADYPNDNGSGFADYPEPSTDLATVESQRICKVINDTYFPEVQINYVNHSNANTRYYYMWRLLSAKTPCVLIEMGQIQDAHDRVLLANTDLIAGGLKKAICLAFGVDPNPTTTTVTTTSTSTTTQTTTTTLQQGQSWDDLNYKLSRIHDIIWGKGWTWSKINQIKGLLPK